MFSLQPGVEEVKEVGVQSASVTQAPLLLRVGTCQHLRL